MNELPNGWANDFDLFAHEYVDDPFPIWATMRKECPVARSSRYGGAVLPSRHADIAAAAHATDVFSSRAPEATGTIPAAGSELRMPPITSDPPEHEAYRRLILPLFTKPQVRKLETLTLERTNGLLDAFAGREVIDIAEDFAPRVPITVISHMLGVPESDGDMFKDWVVELLKIGPRDQTVRVGAIRKISRYFAELVDEQRTGEARENGIVDLLVQRQNHDELTTDQLVGMCLLLLTAGIDTTWSMIGSSLWHLAHHPADRRRLAENPDLLDGAIEEFLRAFAPVTVARITKRDTRVGDVDVEEGSRVLLSFPAANRDPEVFDAPDEVILDRQENRHLAFGLGIHRCAGSNLARMELRIVLAEWLRRYPEFDLDPGTPVTWSTANVRGPESLVLRVPAKQVG